MSGNFLLYLYYLWTCMSFYKLQGSKSTENDSTHDTGETDNSYPVIDHVVNYTNNELSQRARKIDHTEHALLKSYFRGDIDTLEMKNQRVLLSKARNKCMELENLINEVAVHRY